MSEDKHPPHWSIRVILAAAWFGAALWMILAWGWWGWLATIVAYVLIGQHIVNYAVQPHGDEEPEKDSESATDTEGQSP